MALPGKRVEYKPRRPSLAGPPPTCGEVVRFIAMVMGIMVACYTVPEWVLLASLCYGLWRLVRG